MSSTDSPKPDIKPTAAQVFKDAVRQARTTDGFDNFVSRLGLNNDNALSAGTYLFNYITRNRILLEAAYRGSWIVGRVIDSIPEAMTRAGIDIETSDEEEDLDEVHSAISRLQIWNSLRLLAQWGRLYGGAIAVIQIEGQDLSTPLDLDTIGEDQFQGLVVYDRWQLNPSVTDLIDSGPEMGLPSQYQIVNNLLGTDPSAPTATGMQVVHYSRCIRFTGIDLPYYQAITEMMWGESILERLWDRLIAFDNATMSCASLIDRANLRMVGLEGLREVISGGPESPAYQGLISFFEMMRKLQVNEGITLLDKNDEFSTTAYSFAGLSDMMIQFGQQLAGASQTPLVVLFGQSPAGLSATGESDMRMYYDFINAQQESKFRNGVELLLKVLWRSEFGKDAPDDMEFTFTPLWQIDANDKANNAKTTVETILGAFENNVIDKPTAMRELRDTSGSTGLFSNITDEQIKEAEEEPPPMPDMAEGEGDNPLTNNPQDPAKKPVKNFDQAPLSPYQKIKNFLKGK